jgi:hypothetical protein
MSTTPMMSIRSPAKPIHPAIDLLFTSTSQHDGRTGSSRGVDFGRQGRYVHTGGLVWQRARFTWLSAFRRWTATTLSSAGRNGITRVIRP